MSNETGKVTKTLFVLMAVMVICVLAFNLYTFYIRKDYQFSVELPCSLDGICFIRDCSDGECPPNNLERYRLFTLQAATFDSCQGDSCQNLCESSGSPQCREIPCNTDNGDVCTGGLTSTTE